MAFNFIQKETLVFFCKFKKNFKNNFWIKCRIPNTRPIYSPVNFSRENVGQIICLHFSNSLVNMLAKSLVHMLTKGLVNMLATSLVNMLAKSLLNMLAEALVNMVNMHW